MAFTFSFTTTKAVADFLSERTDKSQLITQLLEDYINRDPNAVSEEEQQALQDIIGSGCKADFKVWQSLHERAGKETSARDYLFHKEQGTRTKRIGELLGTKRNDNSPNTPTDSSTLHPM